jgi:glycosyltransferase involved in cell wall biosynthesis
LKVLFAAYPHIGLNHGGLQIQMEETQKALLEDNIEVSKYDCWDPNLAHFDVLHCFSIHSSLLPIIQSAKSHGIKVVVSTVFNAYFRSSFLLGMQVRISKQLRGLFSALKSASQIIELTDCIIALSEDEKMMLIEVFGCKANKIEVIPNGIDPIFFSADKSLFAKQCSLKKYVVCIGKIEPRKNQRSLIKACSHLGRNLVLVGPENVLYPEYLELCKTEAQKDDLFLGLVANTDPLLPSILAGADIFALVSKSEVLPISALEAYVVGTKLLLPQKSALQSLIPESEDILYTNGKVSHIVSRLNQLQNVSPKTEQRSNKSKTFRWSYVANKLVKIYE